MEFKTVARATGTQHSITCASPVSQTPDQLVLKRPPEAAISCSGTRIYASYPRLDGVLCRPVASAALWSGPFLCGVFMGGAGRGWERRLQTQTNLSALTIRYSASPAQPSPGRQKSLNYWVSAPARPAQPGQHPPPPLRPVADWIMAPLTIFIPDIELLCSVYKHFIIASFNW